MNPDQIASNDLGPYCLLYWLPISMSRREEQTTKVVTGGKMVKKDRLIRIIDFL